MTAEQQVKVEQFYAEHNPNGSLKKDANGNYIKKVFYITEKGNISCSAEAVYSYLFKDKDFVEDHTALSDCEIEAKILQAVFDRKQKLETKFCSPVFRQKVWKERLKLSM